MSFNYAKYVLMKPFITCKENFFLNDRFPIPSKFNVDIADDRKKIIYYSVNNLEDDNNKKHEEEMRIEEEEEEEEECNRKQKTEVSIFFAACAKNDVGLVNYCINDCKASLESTEYINEYKDIMNCSNGCDRYNCLFKTFPRREKITPLMYAILKGNYYAVKFLNGLGANVNFQTQCFRITPLLLACRMKNISIIKLLLKNGANLNHRDALNRTCLIHAVANVVCNYRYDDRFNDFNRVNMNMMTFHKYKIFLNRLFCIVHTSRPSGGIANIMNEREHVRNYTILHLAMKFFDESVIDLLLKYGARPSLKAYNNNDTKNTLLLYKKFTENNSSNNNYSDDNNNNEDDDDFNNKDNIGKQNFLCYCLCNVRFNCLHSPAFVSFLINKNIACKYFSRKEVSDACLILYLEFLKSCSRYNNDQEKRRLIAFVKSHIDDKKHPLVVNKNYPHFMDDDYFNLCLDSLGYNNKIIYKLYMQRCVKNNDDSNYQNIVNDSLTLLNGGEIILGNELWTSIFKQLFILNNESSSCNYILDVLHDCTRNEFEKYLKYQRNNNNNTNYKFFNHFNEDYKNNFMFTLFEAVCVNRNINNYNDDDDDDIKMFKKKIKELLLFIEKINKGIENDFSVFYEVMRYIKMKIYEEEHEGAGWMLNTSKVLPKHMNLLNLIKSFNEFDMYRKISTDTAIKFRHLFLTTPLTVALLCGTKCEREEMCKHNEKNKYIKLIDFFMKDDFSGISSNNTNGNCENKCISYFVCNYYVLKRYLPK